MRQGQQQNRRGRGRGGRKGQNPLSRSFESSGPDIKIRGTAQHIAEKYMALARDAIGSGDLVLGENYLQHAEHYNRIIMAAQPTAQNGFDQGNGNGQRIARPEGDLMDGDSYDGDDDGDTDQPGVGGGFEQPRAFEPNNGPNNGNGNSQREHQPYQQPPHQSGHNNHGHQNHQPRFRDNRNYDNRNNDGRSNDGRNNQPRSFEPRNQGPQDHRTDNRGSEHNPRRYEPRDAYEPRYPARDVNGNGVAASNGGANATFTPAAAPPVSPAPEQPRPFEQPRLPAQADLRDGQPGFEPRQPQGDVPGPRGRRRRSRHENGPNRPFGSPGEIAGNGEAPANSTAEPQPQPQSPAQPSAHPPMPSDTGGDVNGNSGGSDGQI